MNTKELEKRCNELFFQVNEKTERIAELEKENAELRERLQILNLNGCIAIRDLNDQLTKAKEIIKAFLDSSDLNIKHKAEEFLGEF